MHTGVILVYFLLSPASHSHVLSSRFKQTRLKRAEKSVFLESQQQLAY